MKAGYIDDAHVHTENAKSYAADDTYNLGQMMALQAMVWHRQRRLEHARSKALHATDILKLGVTRDIETRRTFLQMVRFSARIEYY